MKRFSLRALFLVVGISAFAVWWMDDGYRKIFSETSQRHGKLEIFGREDSESKQYQVRIRFTPVDSSPSDTHLSKTLLFKNQLGKRISLFSVVDEESATWLVCDQNQGNLVVLILAKPANPPQHFRQIWHPGIHVDWLRGLWAMRFDAIKASNADIPYDRLPNEVKVVTVD